VLIRYWDHLDLISISTFFVVGGAAAPILLGCSLVVSAIFGISSQFQKNMEQKRQTYEDKPTRKVCIREVRSCQVLRFQIGNFYHMEGNERQNSRLSTRSSTFSFSWLSSINDSRYIRISQALYVVGRCTSQLSIYLYLYLHSNIVVRMNLNLDLVSVTSQSVRLVSFTWRKCQ
jgi:hypothetical protein